MCMTLGAAIVGAIVTVFIPAITRQVLDVSIPNEDFHGIIRNLLIILVLVLLLLLFHFWA